MQSKLTLRLDEKLIWKAKLWAKNRRVSLSQAVAAFFVQLVEEEPSDRLCTWTRQLTGAVGSKDKKLTGARIRENYLDCLEEKHL